MSIFRRDRDSTPPGSASAGPGSSPGKPPEPASARGEGRVTRIAPGTRVEGRVGGATELLVEGEVVGEVRVDALVVVGPGGVVQGPVAARVVKVAGKVVGDVRGSERVEIDGSGSVEGDVAAPRVVIAEGAFFKGRVEMQGDRAGGERPASGAAGRTRPD